MDILFTIKAAGEFTYSIINNDGQALQVGSLNGVDNSTIEVKDLFSGIYYVIGKKSHNDKTENCNSVNKRVFYWGSS